MRNVLSTIGILSVLLLSTACSDGTINSSQDKIGYSLKAESSEKNLKVPYYCQMDNRVEPHATCSNSSLAMVLDFYGKKSIGGYGNLAEQLYNSYGKLNSIQKIASTAKKLGFKASKRVPSSFDQIKNDVKNGKPVIVGGDFVGRAGHFVVVKGFNSKGFFVHDPYGLWDQRTVSPSNGYGQKLCDRGYTGRERFFTNAAMKKAAGSGFWTVTVF